MRLLYVLAAGASWPAAATDDASGGHSMWDHPLVVTVLGTVIGGVIVALILKYFEALSNLLKECLARWFSGSNRAFRKRYLSVLVEQHSRIRLIGLRPGTDTEPPRLKEVYVAPRLTIGTAVDAPRVHWHDIFLGSSTVALLGAPGAGKSTLLDYLLLVLSGEVNHLLRDNLGRPWPLYARLRDLELAGGEPRTIVELLRSAVPLQNAPGNFPEEALKRGGCVVLLDGLDEVLDPRLQAAVVKQIAALPFEFRHNRFVVTCRVASWQQQLPQFRAYCIQELDNDGIREFVAAWYREVLRSQLLQQLPQGSQEQRAAAEQQAFAAASERAAELWAALQANDGLLRVTRTPLILSLVALVHHRQDTKLPQGRAALYERCLQILLEEWDRDEHLLEPRGLLLGQKLQVLQAIAPYLLLQGTMEASADELAPVLEPLLGQLNGSWSGKQLLREIWQRSGILVDQGLGRFGFAHRALQDYLAAKHFVARNEELELLAHVGEERWREVILIAVGLAPAKRAQALVRRLLARPEDLASLELAGRCLAEHRGLGDKLRAEVCRHLEQQISLQPDAETFGRLTSVLVEGEPGAAHDWAAGILNGSDDARHQQVLFLLPALGPTHGRPFVKLLLELLADATKPLQLRLRAAAALSAIAGSSQGLEPSPRDLKLLAGARQDREPVIRMAANVVLCELGCYQQLGLVRVGAGQFLMGADDGDPDERPRHALYLPTFYIGRHPVTADELRAWNEGGHQQARAPGNPGAEGLFPAVGVPWQAAMAFAHQQGLVLPSEAEWEKAARGTDGWRYPWGNDWRDNHANTRDLCTGNRSRPNLATTPVGQFSPHGDSFCGCADMLGNVWEWTRSLYRSDHYKFSYPYDPVDGRENLDAPRQPRVLRGGSYDSPGKGRSLLSAREWASPLNSSPRFGFRVAVVPALLEALAAGTTSL